MTAKIIYTAITLDLPLWAVKAIEKSFGLSYGRVEKRSMGAIVCLHGTKSLGLKS
jgi:hypothetical protein